MSRPSLVLGLLGLLLSTPGHAEPLWRVTAYCKDARCTGKYPGMPGYGVMASGKRVYVGAVACNWLPFGQQLEIDGQVYTVEDRGATSIFGTVKTPRYALDVYLPTHEAACQWGVRYLPVKVLQRQSKDNA